MTSVNQKYNKTININPLTSPENPNVETDLCSLTYEGKLTIIVSQFNKLPLEKAYEIVHSSFTEELKRNPLQICSFLNYSNIFLYLLTYDADSFHCDENNQSTWHFLSYRGHTRLLSILINHLRYKIKIETISNIDKIKKKFGFSNLDIVNGNLSKAVHKNKKNIDTFNNLQKTLKEEAEKCIINFMNKLNEALSKKDKEGQTPLHLAAMSKFPLSHKIIYQILDFNFFKFDESWNDYLNIYQELQSLEIKIERMNDDPRRCMRLERELNTLLGDKYILNDLEPKFNEIKKELLKKIINTPDNNGDSILHISTFHGDFRIVNKLVFNGGNKKLKNSLNKIPVDMAKDNFVRKVLTNLNKAAKNSDSKNITELVNFGEDINKKKTIFRQAPIHKIIESHDKKKYEVLKQMLDMGADPNIRDSNGWSALHYACQFGDLESVKILIENNANIDTYSNNQRIPLHLASNMNYPEVVKFLLENKSNPNYKDELGCTPMHLASKQGNTKCIEYLLLYGADLYCIDFRGWNILHYAAFHGHKKTVRFISKYDADFDILRDTRNSQNKLPIEIVRDPSVKPYFNSLWHAAKEGNLDMTRNILNDGEDINEQSQFLKNTPLHLAVINDHYLEVRLLLEHNANCDLKNKDDKTVYQYSAAIFELVEMRYEEYEDKERGMIDLRDVVRNILNKKDEIVDAIVCRSNWDIRIWIVRDFAEKIFKALGLDKEKEKNDKNEGEENNTEGHGQNEQNNSIPN